MILSASLGGIINDRGVIFVAQPDIDRAIAAVRRMGIDAVSE
jgi:hypothetical protein